MLECPANRRTVSISTPFCSMILLNHRASAPLYSVKIFSKYLDKKQQSYFRRKLQSAYEIPTYEKAKKKFEIIKKELFLINKSAVNSLEEGFEETLTLHRLGMFEKIGISFKTAKFPLIESTRFPPIEST